MSTLRVDTITDEAGTGPVEFTNGINVSGGTVTGVEPFKYNAVSGTTQALDVGSYNFFDAGTLTADTTVSFSNVPTEARWTYTAEIGASELYYLEGPSSAVASAYVGGDSLEGLAFSVDGTQMYTTNNRASYYNDAVYQQTLSVPWDLNSAESVTQVFSVQSQDDLVRSLAFSSDGTKMYVIGDTNDRLFQYTLSTAWSISTASYDSVSLNLGLQDTSPSDIYFKPDGTKMYMVGLTGDRVYQYTLSTAWSISTASYDGTSFYVGGQDANPVSVTFKSDGTKMFVVGLSTLLAYQYTLSTPWAVSTASYDSVSRALPANAKGLTFSSAGDYLYVVSRTGLVAYQYEASLSTLLTLPSSVENPPTSSAVFGDHVSYTFFTADGGTTVKLINEEVL